MQRKTAYLIILCCVLLHMNMIGSDNVLYHAAREDLSLIYYASLGATYFFYPLLGWMADVYFTRYKFVQFSFFTMIVATILVIISVSLNLKFQYVRSLISLGGLTIAIGLIGMGLFESTAIQFGMDQMLEASSDQLSTFIHWYYWSLNLGRLIILYLFTGVVIYFSQCTISLDIHNASELSPSLSSSVFPIASIAWFFMAGLQLVCACVGLCLLVRSKKYLNIDRTGQHPLKLIYKVLRYAWNHTCPENRSAFTYWENDIPPRIDLGKSKYGGPFTTEEVEDTKSFLRILLLLLSLLGFHLSGHGYSTLKQLVKSQCPSYWLLISVVDPMYITILTVIVGVPVYQLITVRCCQRYRPNMLKRMGLGLLCCLIKDIFEIIIQATMTRNEHCKYIDNRTFVSCYLLRSELIIDGICSDITELTNNTFFCVENNTPFLLMIIPNLLQGLSFLLVFMTALEFICAQAPLRLKGLLIGLWYASLAVTYLVVEIPETFITDSITWEILHEVKAFLIFLFLMFYLCVSKRYHYRQRDEVVNEQYLVEEIYERELDLAEEYEREMAALLDDVLVPSNTYGSTTKRMMPTHID